MHILTIDRVSKSYHNHIALNAVSFNVKKGCIFGLLGPNGAGKTSLIRIITGITGADDGGITLDGVSLNLNSAADIGYMPEERGLYKKMKVAEQLMYLAQLKGLSKKEAQENIMYWFERLDMKGWWDKKIEELSKGMQQKVQFVATVAHKPKLLILDEPFSGLDPLNADILKDEIYKLNQDGTSIIFSTHRMEQVEEICDDIVLINKGEILLNDSVANVKQNFKEQKYSIHTANQLGDLDFGSKFEIIERSGNKLLFKINEGNNSNDLLSHLLNNNIHINAFNEVLPTLNEIFIKLIKGDNLDAISFKA
jgi:ABC-2 type transport system ATP-binding protein